MTIGEQKLVTDNINDGFFFFLIVNLFKIFIQKLYGQKFDKCEIQNVQYFWADAERSMKRKLKYDCAFNFKIGCFS